MRVRREGDHLAMQLSGQGQVEELPMSETEFFAKAVKATPTFVADGEGRASALIRHQNDGAFVNLGP